MPNNKSKYLKNNKFLVKLIAINAKYWMTILIF